MAGPKGMKDYNRIRRFLQQIYLYGFFSREDFQRAGIGGVKDYDYGAGLLRTLYPEMDTDARWQGGKKYLRFPREYAKSGEDRLADSYLLHTMKEEELLQILCIFSACARTPKTLDELCAAVELMGLASEGTVYSTVRRRVLELEEYGYLQRTGKQIRMRESLLAGLEEAELLALEDYVRFSAGVTYPRVAGSFLRRSIRRELERRGLEERTESPFLFRGNVKCNVFDEVVVCQLLEAIQQRREAGCFLSQEEIEKLKSSLGTPDGTQESIQLPGCAAQAMLPQRENLRVILQAMRQGRMVDYEYRTREDRRPKSASAVPWKVEYGAFDRGVILRKLLSLGPGVTLLGPASLQEELLDLLEQTRTRQEQAIL